MEKRPQKRMECFRLLLEHLAWIEHQFLSGIRDSRKAGSLWGMMRGEGGVKKSIHQSWLTKRYRNIGLMSTMFANGPGDWGSIPGRVIPKTQKMVLDAALLNTQHYKVRIKCKVDQFWELCSALSYISV